MGIGERIRKLFGSPVSGREPEHHVPEFSVFDLTWGIPTNFGGMTSVMLQRSAAFGQYLDKPVDILTLDPSVDVVEAETRLRAAGVLGARTRIRGLWHEIRAADDTELAAWFDGAPQPAEPAPEIIPGWEQRTVIEGRTEYSSAGKVVQARVFRTDGSLVVVDDRTTPSRRITVFDRHGEICADFARVREFYFAWFDHLVGDTPSVMINESKTTGAWVHSYRRPNVLLCQVMHNSHLEPEASSAYGPFTAVRRRIIENNENFGVLAFLTQTQKADFEAAFGVDENRVVLPNSYRPVPPDSTAPAQREAGWGMVLASLDRRKRVEDAVDAVSALPDGLRAEVTLDIYGEGKRHRSLAARIAAAGLTGRVRLEGYTSDAAAQLRRHSFLVLSSRAEGMGLVLIEAMAQGCIPIAYDVRYGPADIIADGCNGFLVADGDVSALSRTIAHVATLPEQKIAELRAAARQRAEDFGEQRIAEAWRVALDAGWQRKASAQPEPPKLVPSRVHSDYSRPEAVEFTVVLPADAPGAATVDLVADAVTDDGRFGFRETVQRLGAADEPTFRLRVPAAKLQAGEGAAFNIYLRHRGGRLGRRCLIGRVAAEAGSRGPRVRQA